MRSEAEYIEKFLLKRQILCFSSPGLDTFFLHFVTKKHSNRWSNFSSYKPGVTSSAERSGVYREVFVEKTDFVFQFTGYRYIFSPLCY
ncbi:hypothetical protein ACFP3I_07535 [Chryseobacterium arachidis]|uniref:hypothetical protein n=1 Tax=Chryseobacterium arachidis TaxID=1416778 RepID=UPI003616DC94